MALHSDGCYATVWDIKEGKGNYVEGRISISKKVADGYEQDFSSYVRFCGGAKDIAKNLKDKDRIHIKSFSVNNSYNKETKTTYWNVAIFDIEKADSSNKNEAPKKPAEEVAEYVEENEDELPF